MAEERKSTRRPVAEGIQKGLGILAAVKDAIEETLTEARERGDLSPEKAREIVKGALDRAQAAAGAARDRLDLAREAEVAELRETVAALKERIRILEERLGVGGTGGGTEERRAGAEAPESPGHDSGSGVTGGEDAEPEP